MTVDSELEILIQVKDFPPLKDDHLLMHSTVNEIDPKSWKCKSAMDVFLFEEYLVFVTLKEKDEIKLVIIATNLHFQAPLISANWLFKKTAFLLHPIRNWLASIVNTQLESLSTVDTQQIG